MSTFTNSEVVVSMFLTNSEVHKVLADFSIVRNLLARGVSDCASVVTQSPETFKHTSSTVLDDLFFTPQ